MKAVAYIRVSTKEQDEEVQINTINEFAGKRGIQIMQYYVDKGESGAKPFKQRPQALRLLNELEKLKPQAIVVFALDRLGRTMVDTLSTVLEFEEKGIKVISVKEEWLQTLNDNIRKLILSILSWVAEFERKRIRERQEEAWKMGKQKGRPPKVRDEVLRKYLKRYKGLQKKAIWKIMCQDGYELSYQQFLMRLKRLTSNEGKITRSHH